MTVNLPKASRARFKADLEEYLAISLALEVFNYKGDLQGLDDLNERCIVAEDNVLGQRAPNLDAIADKLMILWDDQIWLETKKTTQMQIIIGDLRLFARSAK